MNEPTSDEKLGMEHAVRKRVAVQSSRGPWEDSFGWFSDESRGVWVFEAWSIDRTAGRHDAAVRVHRISLVDYRGAEHPGNVVQTIEFRRYEVRSLVAAGLKLLDTVSAIGALGDEPEPERVTT